MRRCLWGKRDAPSTLNGIEFVQRPASGATIIDINVWENDGAERLERFLSRFLIDCAGESALIADIRCPDDDNEFPFSGLEHPWTRRRQIIGELSAAHIRNFRLNWFNAHYALLCVGGDISTSDEYAHKASRLCPDAALKKRLIRAYIAGETLEGYTLGIAGAHPEILTQLMQAFSGE